MNPVRLIAIFFLLNIGILPVFAAKTRYFVEGITVEAELQADTAKPHLVVTRYDENQESHQIFYGDLTDEGGGKCRLVNESSDGDGKWHTLTCTVKIAGGELSYSDLKDSRGKPDAPASGGPWKEINEATLLANARARYESADKRLNEAWKQAREETGEKDLPALRERQRIWIQYRDRMAERAAIDLSEDKDVKNKEAQLPYWQAMTKYTASRTPVLRAWSGKSVPPGRSGIYRDSFGGEVTLEEKKDGLHFEISVVRSPAFHTGNLSGTAKPSGESASWTDAPKSEGKKVAKLRFKFNANRSLTLESEGAEYYHGARARFDGWYFKVAPLKADESK
jgi:uncharacterized protein YecT (DUF1311 family)